MSDGYRASEEDGSEKFKRDKKSKSLTVSVRKSLSLLHRDAGRVHLI